MSTQTQSNPKKKTIPYIQNAKSKKQPISMLTAYDFQMARILDEADIDILLVGDSVGEVCLGYTSTLPVSLSDIIHHTKAVVNGTKQAVVVADMPFLSFQISPEEAVKNAGTVLKETGCDAVKIEGGKSRIPTIRALLDAGIPVMGHIGLQPQSIRKLGSYRVQGKKAEQANLLLEDALALQEAGIFSLVLELVEKNTAAQITQAVEIPTIGIGSGNGCDGQVLVINDMLGMDPSKQFKHCRLYANLYEVIQQAVKQYIKDVTSKDFPADHESFSAESKKKE